MIHPKKSIKEIDFSPKKDYIKITQTQEDDLMDPLFKEQAQFEKVARVLLSQDATKWTKEILDHFFTEFSFFLSQNVEVQFKKKDADKGYAVGTINVGELAVPIIITDYQLSPLDVVYKDGITLPLTNETLGAIAKSESAFKRVVPPDNEMNDVDKLFQIPMVDLQASPTLGKYGSVIDRISGTVTKEMKDEMMSRLEDDVIKTGFLQNDTTNIIDKIRDIMPQESTHITASLSKVLPRDIHYVEKVSRFESNLVEGNSNIYDPIITELDTKQAEEYEQFMAVGTDFEKKAEFNIARGASYEVEGFNDNMVLMNVDGMRKYAYSQIDVSSPTHCNKTFKGDMPMVSDYGVFVDGNKASKPFEITELRKVANSFQITGVDGAVQRTYIPLRSVEEVTPHETYDNTYYIPTRYKFVKVGESVDVVPTPININHEPLNYYTKDDVGFYRMSGPVFKKYAQISEKNISSMRYNDAVWSALQCKASQQDVTKMASAPINIRIPFNSELRAPVSLEKTASYISSKYAKVTSKIKGIAVDLIKEASTFADPTSVDAILALNMVTKDNVLEFVRQLPLYEQVLSDLAKILLTSRLGLFSIPEMAVQKAMKELSKIVEILRGMSNLDKVK